MKIDRVTDKVAEEGGGETKSVVTAGRQGDNGPGRQRSRNKAREGFQVGRKQVDSRD